MNTIICIRKFVVHHRRSLGQRRVLSERPIHGQEQQDAYHRNHQVRHHRMKSQNLNNVGIDTNIRFAY